MRFGYKLFGLLASLLLLPLAASAQTTTPSTTLSAAINNSQNTFQVASATGIVPAGFSYTPAQTPGNGTALVVDGEVMNVIGLSGKQVQVQRGAFGTRSTYHNSGATVYVINLALGTTSGTQGLNPAALSGPLLASPPSGACVVANTYSPTFAVLAYSQMLSTWTCTSSVWTFGTFK